MPSLLTQGVYALYGVLHLGNPLALLTYNLNTVARLPQRGRYKTCPLSSSSTFN
jgi:hypothetical protein